MQGFFFTYVHFQDMQCIYIFQNHPAPHLTTPSPPQKRSARQTVENMRTSHVSYFLCHATYALRSSHWQYFQVRFMFFA